MYACAACSNVGALASATRSAKNGEGRSWMFRTRRDGKLRDMGLGGWRSVTLEKARRKAAALREVLQGQWDPTFSEHSYGFRPGRSPFSTVETARRETAGSTGLLPRLRLPPPLPPR